MMGNYILQTIAFQLAFLLVYQLLLKKETFFNYNRIYLLLTPVLAMLLPFLEITSLKNAIFEQSLIELPEVFINSGSATAAAASQDLFHFWAVLYAAGFLVSLFLLIRKFYQLSLLAKNGKKSRRNGVDIIEVPNSTLAFSFNKLLFLGEELEHGDREQIISHEMVHVQHRHTLDLLFFELLKVFLWFDPLIYIFQSKITALHEFQADAGVVKKVEKQRYFQQLLNTAFDSRDISFVNQFYNKSIIKKRIIMLQRNKSKTVSKLKYLTVLPLMLLMLIYVSGTGAMAQEKQNPQKTDGDSVRTNIPFAVVEEVPVYPGCEGLESRQEKKECFSQNINNFVNTNFNTGLGKELGLTGLNRVYVKFKISTSGEIVDVDSRASHPALGEEAERVIKMLPKMQPGKSRGEKVAVMYALPINFMVPEPEKENKDQDKK